MIGAANPFYQAWRGKQTDHRRHDEVPRISSVARPRPRLMAHVSQCRRRVTVIGTGIVRIRPLAWWRRHFGETHMTQSSSSNNPRKGSATPPGEDPKAARERECETVLLRPRAALKMIPMIPRTRMKQLSEAEERCGTLGANSPRGKNTRGLPTQECFVGPRKVPDDVIREDRRAPVRRRLRCKASYGVCLGRLRGFGQRKSPPRKTGQGKRVAVVPGPDG